MHPQTLLLFIVSSAIPLASSFSGDCETVQQLLKPITAWKTPYIVSTLRKSCASHFSSDAAQKWECLKMADGMVAIVENAPTDQAAINQLARSIILYSLIDPAPPARSNFIVEAQLGTWGSVREFLDCNALNSASSPYFQARNTELVMAPDVSGLFEEPFIGDAKTGQFITQGATSTHPPNCSQADRLFIPRNNSSLVKYLIKDCENCFNNFNQSVELGQCIEMVMGINVIVVSSTNDHVYSTIRQIHRWINSPTEAGFDGRKKFLQNATLGKWGTLKELFECAEKSTTTTTTTTTATTTATTTTTTTTTTSTTASDRCKTVGEQVKSTHDERSPLSEAIWRAGVQTSSKQPLRKLLLKALANRIQIALENAPQPRNSRQLVQAAKDVLVAWIDANPYLKEHLVSIQIGNWGTVCDFLHCVSATYPCTTAPPTTTTPSSRCQTVSDTIETVGQTSPLSTAIADACNQPPTCSPFKKMLFMSLSQIIDKALNKKPDAKVTQKLQMVKKIIIDWQNDNPNLKSRLENTKINHWGTVGEFLNCPS